MVRFIVQKKGMIKVVSQEEAVWEGACEECGSVCLTEKARREGVWSAESHRQRTRGGGGLSDCVSCIYNLSLRKSVF